MVTFLVLRIICSTWLVEVALFPNCAQIKSQYLFQLFILSSSRIFPRRVQKRREPSVRWRFCRIGRNDWKTFDSWLSCCKTSGDSFDQLSGRHGLLGGDMHWDPVPEFLCIGGHWLQPLVGVLLPVQRVWPRKMEVRRSFHFHPKAVQIPLQRQLSRRLLFWSFGCRYR